MKKLIISITVLMFFATSAYAVKIKHRSGITVSSNHRGDNLFTSSTKVSTTGLTFSTSAKQKKTTKKATLERFVAFNIENVSFDIAKGYGEYLDAIAEISEISSDKKEKFNAKLKADFDLIFPSEELDYKRIVAQIMKISDEV